MTDPIFHQPEDNEALDFWMWCEEQEELERLDIGDPDEAQEWHDFDPDC